MAWNKGRASVAILAQYDIAMIKGFWFNGCHIELVEDAKVLTIPKVCQAAYRSQSLKVIIQSDYKNVVDADLHLVQSF